MAEPKAYTNISTMITGMPSCHANVEGWRMRWVNSWTTIVQQSRMAQLIRSRAVSSSGACDAGGEAVFSWIVMMHAPGWCGGGRPRRWSVDADRDRRSLADEVG